MSIFNYLSRLLGHLYAGEALISLGRVPEAVTHLDPRLVGDMTLSPPSQEAGQSFPLTQPSQGQCRVSEFSINFQ